MKYMAFLVFISSFVIATCSIGWADVRFQLVYSLKNTWSLGCVVGKTDWRTREVELATQAENSRLQEELDKIHRQPFPVTVQESAKVLHTYRTSSINTES